MIIKKITAGFVIQTFDTETNTFVSQEFIAGDQVDYEDEYGNILDDEYHPDNEYLCYDMVQP